MRKEEKTRLRREKIITAALFEFATKGYQGFVINELCKKVLSSMNFVKWMVFPKEFCIIIFQGNQTSI